MATVGELLFRQADRVPDRPALWFGGHTVSYREVASYALRLARGLRELGVREGDTVCVMLPNHPDYVYVWFAVAWLGAVMVPINIHLKGESLTYILDHSDARVLIYDVKYTEQVTPALDQLARFNCVVVRRNPGDITPVHETCRLADLYELPEDSEGATLRPEKVHAILYTSGTTGMPKGVMLSHCAYVNSARHFAEDMVRAGSDDVLYTCLPLFHINAQAHTVLPAFALGAMAALGERFSASRFWDEIRESGATVFNSLAAMIPILCKQPPSPRDRNHRARVTACAATPKDVWTEFERRFGVKIIEGYGLTETAGFCMTNPYNAVRIGSMGKPMGFVEMMVADEEGQPLPPGQPGEVLIRARQPHVLMEGYYKDPQRTAEALRNGWFHTGDRAYMDEDGFFYFVDRVKQIIRRRGENISSWEVEKVVNAHPDVLESAAVGVPSELGEEEVKICVVPRPGRSIDPVDLIRWCEERMAYFMVPRYVEIRESLPKTATERVEKYKLKEEGIGNAWDREAAGYKLRRSG